MKIKFQATNAEFEVHESSSIEAVSMTLNSFSDIDRVVANFSDINMKRVLLNDVEYERIKPLSVLAEKAGNKVLVTFRNRQETFEEKTKAKLQDIQNTLAVLVEGEVE